MTIQIVMKERIIRETIRYGSQFKLLGCGTSTLEIFAPSLELTFRPILIEALSYSNDVTKSWRKYFPRMIDSLRSSRKRTRTLHFVSPNDCV